MYSRAANTLLPGSALSLRLLSAHHGQVPVLGDLSFSLSKGETVALTGPSGVGKTTLLRIVAGLHREWKGELERPGKMGMVFQNPTLMPWRTVLENITIPINCQTKLAQNLIAEVGLAGLEDRFPDTLSLGQQRRLSLARALASEPDLLLMDEPFVSLDAKTADEMMDLFERSLGKRKMAVLIVTHSESEANRLATRRLRLEGKPAKLADGR